MTPVQAPESTVRTAPATRAKESDQDTLIERARELAPLIREHAQDMERHRRIARPVLDALFAAGFQGLFAPRSLGGLEVDPLTALRVVEEVARADSAAAWALQSGNVNAWWASRLPQQAIDEIYNGNANGVLVGAAFHPPQRAIEVDGGYQVSGRAPLASMIQDARWMIFSAFIMDGGQPRMTPFGPAMVGVVMRRSELEVIDTWHTLGMRGTDSNDAAFNAVFVPAYRTFAVVPEYERGSHFQGPLYRFPAVPIIALFSVAVLLASARNAIDAFREMSQKKVPMGSMKSLRDRGVVQAGVAEAIALVGAARAWYADVLAASWERTLAGKSHSLEHRAELLIAGVHAARSATAAVDIVHRLAGTTGIYASSPLERAFRDTHTLQNHGFVSESKAESAGQVYLGLPPDFPLLHF
ncbi:MAG TPA: acyl-CoA dehydrogenase family protein [Gemmatimonadaceae bacterium]